MQPNELGDNVKLQQALQHLPKILHCMTLKKDWQLCKLHWNILEGPRKWRWLCQRLICSEQTIAWQPPENQGKRQQCQIMKNQQVAIGFMFEASNEYVNMRNSVGF